MRAENPNQTIESDGERCPSGIPGLDEILAGGLPVNSLFLVDGIPGSGKTTLALQFLLEGVRRGESVFYITLSETRSELKKVAESHGWSFEHVPMLDLSAVESLVRPETQTTVFHSSEVELTQVVHLLLEEIRKVRPARVVFDSLSELRLMAETPLRYRRQLLSLKQEFQKYQSTVLLLDDNLVNRPTGRDPHVLSLAHGVIELEQFVPDYGVIRRRLRVVKLRGVKFREGFHDFKIVKGGLKVFPRLVAIGHQASFKPHPVSSGIKELDALLGGGLDCGTTSLIIGQAGTGKTSITLHYAAQMARLGEKSCLFAFDETLGVLFARGRAMGLKTDEHVQRGAILAQQVDPAELSPGEFAFRVASAVEAGCKLVVIDSLNGYLNAMPGEQHLSSELHELSFYLNQKGVLTLLVLAQHGLLSGAQAPVDISYLSDTVINLRFFEAAGAVKQAIAVVKKRTGDHEKMIREFKLETGSGIRVGPPLREFQGVLTGFPSFHGQPEQMMKSPHAGQ